MPIPPGHFRHTMAHLASGVTVLVALDTAGRAYGMTASAVTSLSLEPPMVLACVDHSAAIHDLLANATVIGVNVLAEDQEAVAVRFADRDRHAFDAAAAERSPAGLPRIAGAIAWLDVRRAAVHPGGDHSILAGTVEWSDTREGAPLLYFRSRYTSVKR